MLRRARLYILFQNNANKKFSSQGCFSLRWETFFGSSGKGSSASWFFWTSTSMLATLRLCNCCDYFRTQLRIVDSATTNPSTVDHNEFSLITDVMLVNWEVNDDLASQRFWWIICRIKSTFSVNSCENGSKFLIFCKFKTLHILKVLSMDQKNSELTSNAGRSSRLI